MQTGPDRYRISTDPSKPTVLYICDGQHRTKGVSEALKEKWLDDNDRYDIPITILFWDPQHSPSDSKLEEAMQFYTINTQQKRMRTDLAHQYIFRRAEADKGPIHSDMKLSKMKKKDYIPYKIWLVNKLNEDEDSPWVGLIQPPNAAADQYPITQGSFTDSLDPVMDYMVDAGLTLGETYRLLVDYWSAIFNLCKEAYTNRNEYVLMKTAGVYSLHIFLRLLLIRRPTLKEHSSSSEFKKILATVGTCFTDDFWERKHGEAATYGTGKKSFQELAEHIASELP